MTIRKKVPFEKKFFNFYKVVKKLKLKLFANYVISR